MQLSKFNNVTYNLALSCILNIDNQTVIIGLEESVALTRFSDIIRAVAVVVGGRLFLLAMFL